MELILQDDLQPEQILDAIVRAAREPVNSLGMGVAYTTLAGSTLLAQRIAREMGAARWDAVSKSLITCFDHGTTEPAALRYWRALPNTEVRIYRPELLQARNFTPLKAFHAKVYYFGRDAGASFIVGSANLTQRALTTNVEAVARMDVEGAEHEFVALWKRLVNGSVVANDQLIDEYEQLREELPVFRADPPINPRPIQPQDLPLLWQLVRDGLVVDDFDNLWLQTAAMTGGARNQLELPRGSNEFFGFDFDDYDHNDAEIGTPILRSGPTTWRDRTLTWKGDNQMERMNLPTAANGGFDYRNKAVLFRRLRSGEYELLVAEWDSDVCNAWRNASAENGNVFRLGANSNRICGVF